MIYYKNSDELYHHGIMGMKWGVRRFQNKDGSLTPAGEARYYKVGGDEKLKKKDTKDARDIYAQTYLSNKTASSVNKSAAARHFEKSREYLNKRDLAEKGSKKANKYNTKYEKEKTTAENLISKSKIQDEIQKVAAKKVADIDSGKLQAGRDFVVQRDLNLWVVPIPTPTGGLFVGAIGDIEKTVIEKKK